MNIQHSRLYKTLKDPYGSNNFIMYETISDHTKLYSNIQDLPKPYKTMPKFYTEKINLFERKET